MESILYQTLKEENKEVSYVKLSGRLKFIKYTVSGVVAIIGGFIADHFGYEMNYWLSLFGYPVAIVLILNLYEPKSSVSVSKKVEWSSMVSRLKTGIKMTWKNNNLKNVIIVSSIIGAILYGQLHEMSMLVYPDLGISVKYFGMVSLGITLIAAFSGLLADRIKEMIKKPYSSLFIFLFQGPIIILFGTVDKWWGVLFLMLAIGILEALTVVYSGFIQNESPR